MSIRLLRVSSIMKMVFLKYELPAFWTTNSSLRCAVLALVLALAGCADKPTYEI